MQVVVDMNYVDDRTVPLCIACGEEIPIQPEDPTAQACDGCFAESEAKAASARQAQAADEFRWMSREWFRTGRLERLPFNSRAERFY